MNTNINESGRYRSIRRKANQDMIHAADSDNYGLDELIGDILDARAQGRSDGALLRYDSDGHKRAVKVRDDYWRTRDASKQEDFTKAQSFNREFDIASGDDALYNNIWFDIYEPDHDPEWCNAVARDKQRTRIMNRSHFAGHPKNRLHNNLRFPED